MKMSINDVFDEASHEHVCQGHSDPNFWAVLQKEKLLNKD